MKHLILSLILLGICSQAYAPDYRYVRVKVRITAYSPFERGEMSINHKGQSIRNEEGFATRHPLIPDGTWIQLPNGEWRVKDDKTARKYSNRIDVRYFDSITAKPKTKAVRKQLRKLDMGYGVILIRKES